jgi:hypothetical protein
MRNLLIAAAGCLFSVLCAADATSRLPKRIGTTADFRQLLLATKWSWRNVSAGVPDRECVFMADGTFRHPNFVAPFTITELTTVELHAKGKKAVLTFSPDYQTFEAIDFEKHRITGRRLEPGGKVPPRKR